MKYLSISLLFIFIFACRWHEDVRTLLLIFVGFFLIAMFLLDDSK